MKIDPPKPGIYPNTPFETYVSWNAMNHSTLKKIAKSAAHFKHALDNPEDRETDSKRFGTSAHALVLEPDKFSSMVVPAPVNPKTGEPFGSGTKAWAEYAEQHKGKLVLTPDELDRLQAVAKKLHSHSSASPLLRSAGMNEVAIVWDDPTTGLRCKGRVDRLVERFGRVDLKTCESAAWSDLSSSMVNYGYHTQDAFYAMGCDALGVTGEGSAFVCVESEAPHEIAVYTTGPDTMGIARTLVGEWLREIVKCQSSGEWPGYSKDVQVVDAPEWYFKRFASALEA